jgi:hypothetical protein
VTVGAGVGGSSVVKAFVGTVPVQRIYVGGDKVWPVQMEYINGGAYAGASVGFGAVTPGDLFVVIAQRLSATAAAAPSVPAAGGTVPVWHQVWNSGSAPLAATMAWGIADSSSMTSGTWTGAEAMTFLHFANGKSVGASVASYTATPADNLGSVSALTPQRSDSLVFAYYANNATAGAYVKPAAGVEDSYGYLNLFSTTKMCVNRKVDTSSVPAAKQGHAASNLHWRGIHFEVLPK